MTRKDYQALARAFHAVRETYGERDGIAEWYANAQLEVVRRCELQIADVLARDNPRFDTERFLTACATGSK